MSAMSDIIVCPACERKVQLPREYLGRSVQCPECKQTFLAGDPATGIATEPDTPVVPSLAGAPLAGAPVPRYPAHYDDEPFDDWGVRRPQLRHDHGGVVLALGIMSIVLGCGVGTIFGPIAYFIGSSDLRAIDNGEMDPSNRSMVQAGRIIGAVGFFLGVFQLIFTVGYFVFLFNVIG